MTVAVPAELAEWTLRVRAATEAALVDPAACLTFVATRDSNGRELTLPCSEGASRTWGANGLDAQQKMIVALVAARRINAFAWVTGALSRVEPGVDSGLFGAHVEWEGGPAFRWTVQLRRRERGSWLGLGPLQLELSREELVVKPAVAFAFLPESTGT